MAAAKKPWWGCSRCGTHDNWATRLACRTCAAVAPTSVVDRLRERQKKEGIEEEQRRGQKGGGNGYGDDEAGKGGSGGRGGRPPAGAWAN